MVEPRKQSLSASEHKDGGSAFALYCLIIMTVLAPWMGGTVKVWTQAFIAICAGLILLVSPPRRSLGLIPNIAFSLLLVLALLSFLPWAWFPVPAWRTTLSEIGVRLPRPVSPQPWITLHFTFLLLLDIAAAYYLLAADWTLDQRRRAWFIFVFAVLGLAGTLSISFHLQTHVPFWPNVPEFGFFPNRNHTSNVLALGGIMLYALALRELSEGRRTWWIWIGALTLVSWALVLNYSRSGIIILCGGMLALHSGWFVLSEQKRRPLLASALILLLMAGFAWDGGKTAKRFSSESTDFFSVTENTRFAIHWDALKLSAQAPLTGTGLGNFSSIFTMDRHNAISGKVAGHPESDWVWNAVELGWLSPLLIGALFGWWFFHCLPFDRGTYRLMRLGAVVSCCGFAAHAFFDVPAHQIGALWPMLLLAGTALHPRVRFVESRAVPVVLRFVGLLLLGFGVINFISLRYAVPVPTLVTLEQEREKMRTARDQDNYAEALTTATRALRIAPLDWSIYQARGAIEVGLHSREDAQRDFGAARVLLPYWSDLWLKQGLLWVDEGALDQGFDLWKEMLGRFPDEAGDLYGQIYQWIKLDAELPERWRELGRDDNNCVLAYLQLSSPAEFQMEVAGLLAQNADLKGFTAPQLERLFKTWYEKGDKLRLAETLRGHLLWEKIAWRQLARAFADYQDYRQAFETVARFSTPPVLPKIDPTQIPLLAARLRVNRDVGNDGLQLATAQFQSGALEDALRTIQIASTAPRAPLALHYMAAQIWASKGDWPKAWQSIAKYERVID